MAHKVLIEAQNGASLVSYSDTFILKCGTFFSGSILNPSSLSTFEDSLSRVEAMPPAFGAD